MIVRFKSVQSGSMKLKKVKLFLNLLKSTEKSPPALSLELYANLIFLYEKGTFILIFGLFFWFLKNCRSFKLKIKTSKTKYTNWKKYRKYVYETKKIIFIIKNLYANWVYFKISIIPIR